MNLDAHTNLGKFPTSKSSNRCFETTVDEMVEFLERNEIDAHICLYPKNGYHLLDELAKRLPSVTHFGLQVVMGYDQSDATDIDKFVYDVNDITKGNKWGAGGHCYGIKLASHRGWWNRQGVIDSGLNYGDSRFVGNILKQLPEDALVAFHMQGGFTYSGVNHPAAIANYAAKFPHLKFIMNHCGDYCLAGLSSRPTVYVDDKAKKGSEFIPPFSHAMSRSLITSSIMFANDLHNIMIDTSLHSPFKSLALKKCKRWAIGSDFPFQRNIDLLYLNERRRFELSGHSLQDIYARNRNVINWLRGSWKFCLSCHEEEYNRRYVPERKKQRNNVSTDYQVYI